MRPVGWLTGGGRFASPNWHDCWSRLQNLLLLVTVHMRQTRFASPKCISAVGVNLTKEAPPIGLVGSSSSGGRIEIKVWCIVMIKQHSISPTVY